MDGTSNLVIGLGEVGKALLSILQCDGIDAEHSATGPYDVLHICFPYSEDFVAQVNAYRSKFKPFLVIIHSTVPVGTSKLLNAVHSPVRGVHPHLEEGIRTFTKFFGGIHAREAAEIFKARGIKTLWFENSKTAEALKLWDTTQYGLNIMIQKEIHRWCEDNGVDFDVVYTMANITYNDGYQKLGMPQYKKYVLKNVPGEIKGHCVIPNLEYLSSPLVEILKNYNASL